MAALIHLTPDRYARRIARSGVAARSRGPSGTRGVYAMPVLPSFALTHQWVRELRRWHPGVIVAVHLRVPDDEPVIAGHYGKAPETMTAAQAVGMIRTQPDPRGYEIFVPRALKPAEVRRVRPVPQGTGWRYQPDAHGRRPCACPVCIARGTPGSARVRRRFTLDEPPRTKPQLMADLRAATTSDEIILALYGLGTRSRGGAEELAYLVEHPDPEVREVLAEVLERYRNSTARRLRESITVDDSA